MKLNNRLTNSISVLLTLCLTFNTSPLLWADPLPKTRDPGDGSPPNLGRPQVPDSAVLQVKHRKPSPEQGPGAPQFSKQPTTGEIIAKSGLVPVGRPSPEENKQLAATLVESFEARPEIDTPVANFLKSYPNSAWKPALLFGLGIHWRQAARFSRAIEAWEEAW